jgi:hypothetical protein
MTFLLLRAGVPLRLFTTQEEARAYLNTLLPQQIESTTFSIYQLVERADALLIAQHYHRRPLGILRRHNWSEGAVRLGTSL